MNWLCKTTTCERRNTCSFFITKPEEGQKYFLGSGKYCKDYSYLNPEIANKKPKFIFIEEGLWRMLFNEQELFHSSTSEIIDILGKKSYLEAISLKNIIKRLSILLPGNFFKFRYKELSLTSEVKSSLVLDGVSDKKLDNFLFSYSVITNNRILYFEDKDNKVRMSLFSL